MKLSDIVAEVEKVRGIPDFRIKGVSRLRIYAHPRQEFCFLACELSGKSQSEIARFLKRDPTTIIHSRRIVKERMEASPEYRDEINRMRLTLLSRRHDEISNKRSGYMGNIRVMPLRCGPRHTRPAPTPHPPYV